MAYTTINKSTDYFNTKLYTGNGTTDHAQTGVGFQPDWTWIKDRSATESHFVFDAVRGHSKYIFPNGNNAEGTDATGILKSFDSDGFTLGTNDGVNKNSDNYASWNWKANGAGSANTSGSINSTVSVNTTAGFSIVKFTTPSSGTFTVGHGLGAVPKVWLHKCLDDTDNWQMYHQGIGNTKKLMLNSTGAEGTSAIWQDTTPTNSLMYLGAAGTHLNANDSHIAYCFAEKTGYSKFGTYTGNENANGTFVYTGMKPAWILVKKSSSGSVQNWYLWDNKRDSFNLADTPLKPDENLAESGIGAYKIDILSNGFKFRGTESQINASGATYIYIAFGQSLVGSNNVPCTAR